MSQMRKERSYTDRVANGSNRPFVATSKSALRTRGKRDKAVSKDHLDAHRLADGATQHFANNKGGHKALIKWLAGCRDQNPICFMIIPGRWKATQVEAPSDIPEE
jgi:hypothetical protein